MRRPAAAVLAGFEGADDWGLPFWQEGSAGRGEILPKRQDCGGVNHGRKSSKSNRDCTICVSCRCPCTWFRRTETARKPCRMAGVRRVAARQLRNCGGGGFPIRAGHASIALESRTGRRAKAGQPRWPSHRTIWPRQRGTASSMSVPDHAYHPAGRVDHHDGLPKDVVAQLEDPPADRAARPKTRWMSNRSGSEKCVPSASSAGALLACSQCR